MMPYDLNKVMHKEMLTILMVEIFLTFFMSTKRIWYCLLRWVFTILLMN